MPYNDEIIQQKLDIVETSNASLRCVKVQWLMYKCITKACLQSYIHAIIYRDFRKQFLDILCEIMFWKSATLIKERLRTMNRQPNHRRPIASHDK